MKSTWIVSAQRVSASSRHDRGAVLVVGLVFLILLTLIGVTAYSVATQEERMAGNTRDRIRAFEAAELALRKCEEITAGAAPPVFTTAGTNGYYLSNPGDDEVVLKKGFDWATSPTRAVAMPAPKRVARDPRCVIEQLNGAPIPASGQSIRAELPQGTGTVYRITAQGVGANLSTAVVLQSYFQRD